MAITTNLYSAALPALFDRLLDKFRKSADTYIEQHSRRAEIDALEAKSDEELAKLGITRDRIVHHVFADRLCY
jgi:uncharacterized protein YjiS (DUF1127 family)